MVFEYVHWAIAEIIRGSVALLLLLLYQKVKSSRKYRITLLTC